MKPLKNLIPTAKWLLRVSALIIIYQKHFDEAATFDFNSLHYFVALALVIASVTLIVGGFSKNTLMTVLSGLAICVFSIIMMFVKEFDLYALLDQFVPASLGFYFLARGNQG
jgi:hypothetical protein